MNRALRIQPFTDEEGYPRLRIVSPNGRILVSSEAYEGGEGHRNEAVILLAEGPYQIVGEHQAMAPEVSPFAQPDTEPPADKHDPKTKTKAKDQI